MARANGNVADNAAAREATRRFTEMSAAHDRSDAARRAALNLMEDAVLSSRRAEALNDQLREKIAEHERAEAQLFASERRFARFMENLPGLAWIKDAEGKGLKDAAKVLAEFRSEIQKASK